MTLSVPGHHGVSETFPWHRNQSSRRSLENELAHSPSHSIVLPPQDSRHVKSRTTSPLQAPKSGWRAMRRDDSGGGQGATREQKTCESCGKARIPSTWSTCNKCAKTSQRKRAREAKDGISDHFWKEYPEERRRDSSQAQCEKLLEAFSDGRAKNELRRLPHWGRAKVAKTAALDDPRGQAQARIPRSSGPSGGRR